MKTKKRKFLDAVEFLFPGNRIIETEPGSLEMKAFPFSAGGVVHSVPFYWISAPGKMAANLMTVTFPYFAYGMKILGNENLRTVNFY